MVRAMRVALVVIAAGCGSPHAGGGDLAVGDDLAGGGGAACGEENIASACMGTAAGSGCYACDFGAGGPGRCALPCLLAAPDCPTGTQCASFTGNGIFAFEGNCAGYGFCR